MSKGARKKVAQMADMSPAKLRRLMDQDGNKRVRMAAYAERQRRKGRS